MASEIEKYWGLTAKHCDSCKTSPAILFCRTDAAYLCATCDARVHPPYLRHERVFLCEVCEHAPASVTCKADAATLCVTCDADIHAANPLARRHERLPVVPFFDPISTVIKPSSNAAFRCGGDEVSQSHAATWMSANPNQKGMIEAPDLNNLFADVDPYLDLDYADSLVPVHATPVEGATAIRSAPPPPPSKISPNAVVDIDFAFRKQSFDSPYSGGHSLSHSLSSSEAGVVPEGGGESSAMADVSNSYGRTAVPANPAVSMDREARVMRYREKRKNRRFEKTIRYASRKAYAETRPRIKGRFTKRVEVDSEADRIFSTAGNLIGNNGYGTVPSF